jgi:hypothetical protein
MSCSVWPRLAVTCLLLLALSGTACAQAVASDTAYRDVLVRAYPSDAEVYLQKPLGRNYLGKANRPLRVPVTTDHASTLRFVVQKSGWQPVTFDVLSVQLGADKTTTIPLDHVVTLAPSSVAVWAAETARERPLESFAGMAALVTGAWLLARRGSRRSPPAAPLAPLPAESASWSGRTLGRWQLQDKLGQGGMAVVYRGIAEDDKAGGEEAAIKILHGEVSSEPAFRERFQREVRICSKLMHPSIIKLLDWGDAPVCYFAMPVVDGKTLRQCLAERGAVPPAEAIKWLQPIFDAVAYAHGRGVIHRDLKPDNIMVSRSGHLYVMDFGIARSGEDDNTVTTLGRPFGTPRYMAPEQVHGLRVDAACDQYALGLIAYEVLSGERLFEGDTAMGSFLDQLGGDEAALPLKGVSERVADILSRMLAPRPEQRFASVREAWQQLESALQS